MPNPGWLTQVLGQQGLGVLVKAALGRWGGSDFWPGRGKGKFPKPACGVLEAERGSKGLRGDLKIV
jgi:hypothetical protein